MAGWGNAPTTVETLGSTPAGTKQNNVLIAANIIYKF